MLLCVAEHVFVPHGPDREAGSSMVGGTEKVAFNNGLLFLWFFSSEISVKRISGRDTDRPYKAENVIY